MPMNKKLVEKLMKLGLTQYEAQAYIALVRLNEATAAKVAEVSRIPRPKVYDALESLERKGFVYSTSQTPVTYIAKSPSEVISLLKKQYLMAFDELEKELTFLSTSRVSEAPKVSFVKNESMLIQDIISHINSANEVIKVCDTLFIMLENKNLIETLQQATKRGVIVKLFTAKENSSQITTKDISAYAVPESLKWIQDVYFLIDRRLVIVRITNSAFSSYIGYISSLRSIVAPITIMFEKMVHESSYIPSLVPEVDPKTIINIFPPEKVIFTDAVDELDPINLVGGQSYVPYLILTNERLLFVGLRGSSYNLFALPRIAITNVNVIPYKDKVYIEVIYQKAGQLSKLYFLPKKGAGAFISAWKK